MNENTLCKTKNCKLNHDVHCSYDCKTDVQPHFHHPQSLKDEILSEFDELIKKDSWYGEELQDNAVQGKLKSFLSKAMDRMREETIKETLEKITDYRNFKKDILKPIKNKCSEDL